LVVGDCNVRGVFVRNSSAIKCLASFQRLRLIKERTRALPGDRRYLPPPGSGAHAGDLSKRMRREVVLTFVAH
jgi:hypothetical protein